MKFKEIPETEVKNQFINIALNSEYTYAFHFFEWEFRAVWEYGFEDMPVAFSEMKGIMTPQKVRDSNKNITKAFKGPDPTYLQMSLIPTHYVNEVEGTAHDGYRVHFENFIRGSTVNKRNLVNRYIASGDELKGMTVQFVVNSSPMFFQVRIQRIKSILEVAAYMLGFLAGFILLIRAAKYYMLKETYFLELEKECEQYFGRHNEIKYEEEDDITNIELMRLERTRNRGSSSKRKVDDESHIDTHNSVIQLDNSELNEDDENDLKKLAI